MKIISKEIAERPYRSQVFESYFRDLRVAVIDIETTGLSPEWHHVILGGLVWLQPDRLQFLQIFADDTEEEADLLQRYMQELNTADLIITYNGDGFDLPFLKRRWIKHFGDADTSSFQSFDLYRVVSKHSPLKTILPNLKQKTIETFLGLDEIRADQISGEESVALYREYRRTRSHALLDQILLHNSDDLLQLSRLLKILDKLDLHRILFYTGFQVKEGYKKIMITSIRFQSGQMVIDGTQRGAAFDYLFYSEAYETFASKSTGQFLLRIPFLQDKKRILIELDPFSVDHDEFAHFSSFSNGMLLVKQADEIDYAAMNSLIRIICCEILQHI